MAFVVDAYARRVLGWRVASTMATYLVLDAIEQAMWIRQQEGVMDLKHVVHHTDRRSQYASIRFSERLSEANALAETVNGLYKTELIRHHGPWRGLEDVEYATLEYVEWFNHRRLHSQLGMIPPAEFEAAFYGLPAPALLASSQ